MKQTFLSFEYIDIAINYTDSYIRNLDRLKRVQISNVF